MFNRPETLQIIQYLVKLLQNQKGKGRPAAPGQFDQRNDMNQGTPLNTATAVEIEQAAHKADPDPYINAYNMQGFSMLPEIVPQNPNVKQFVGEFIYEYVKRIIGKDLAPKITGMLIDLSPVEIKNYLYDYFNLKQRIFEFRQILSTIPQ